MRDLAASDTACPLPPQLCASAEEEPQQQLPSLPPPLPPLLGVHWWPQGAAHLEQVLRITAPEQLRAISVDTASAAGSLLQ